MSGRRVTEQAPAKLNLTLRVLGRQPDGLHELQSLVVPLCWGDTLEVILTPRSRSWDEAPRVTLDCPGHPALQGPHNLAWRAAERLLAAHPGVTCHLRLEKRIPVAAGLGGGSADAAATLRALCRRLDPSPEATRVMSLAAELGADVPVCLRGEPAWVSGWGERLHPAPGLPAFFLCLIHPELAIHTADVFAALDAPPVGPRPALPPAPRTLSALAAQVRNDLWPAVRRAHPDLGRAWRALEDQAPLAVSMSGSGPTLFGIFSTRAAAEAAAAALRTQGYRTTATLFEGSAANIGGKKGRSNGVGKSEP